MTTSALQEHLHVYSMFSFRDGQKEAGICINKYNLTTSCIEFYFVGHHNLQAYKTAFEKHDREACRMLSKQINPENVLNVNPVSLVDYKIIMQLLDERNSLYNSMK
jgi:hypothetical protein